MPSHVRNTPPPQYIRRENDSGVMMNNMDEPPSNPLQRIAHKVVYNFLRTFNKQHIKLSPTQCILWFFIGVIVAAIIIFAIAKGMGIFEKKECSSLGLGETSSSSGSSFSTSPPNHLQYFFF
jgi:hypothetical protein